MYRCPCASRVPIHRSMCIDAHTCIRIRKRACVYVHVQVHQCICASIPMCLRGCLRARVCGVRIYRCTFVRINTHRHTRTYPGGNTHPCVCVCLSVCLSVRPSVRPGKAQAYCKRGFSVQHRSRRQTPQPPKGKQPPMSEVGRRPEQTPSFQRKVEQADTQKHKVEHTSTAGLGWAGLSWGSWGWGRAHGSTPPRGVSLDNDPSHSEGKGPGAGNRNHDSKFEPSEDSGS